MHRIIPAVSVFKHLSEEERKALRALLRGHAKALMAQGGIEGSHLEQSFVDDVIEYVFRRGELSAENPKGIEFRSPAQFFSYCLGRVWSQVKQYVRDDYKRTPAAAENDNAASVYPDAASHSDSTAEAQLMQRDAYLQELRGKKLERVKL